MTYGDDETRAVTCASDTQLIAAIKDNTDFPGAKQFEVAGSGTANALLVSLGPRVRRVRFVRIE